MQARRKVYVEGSAAGCPGAVRRGGADRGQPAGAALRHLRPRLATRRWGCRRCAGRGSPSGATSRRCGAPARRWPGRRRRPSSRTPGPGSSRRRWSSWRSGRASTPEFVRDEIAAGRAVLPAQRQPPGVRADDHRQGVPGEGQRQHRHLGGHLVGRRGGGEADLGHPVGRGHRDGPVHRQADPRDPRGDRAQLAGADRDRADLPGAGEGRRRPGEAELGGVPGDRDRAGRAGRRLHDGARRGAAAVRAAGRGPGHRDRLPGRLDHGGLVPGAPRGELPLHQLRASCARSSPATT